jgi:hypothetical protein
VSEIQTNSRAEEIKGEFIGLKKEITALSRKCLLVSTASVCAKLGTAGQVAGLGYEVATRTAVGQGVVQKAGEFLGPAGSWLAVNLPHLVEPAQAFLNQPQVRADLAALLEVGSPRHLLSLNLTSAETITAYVVGLGVCAAFAWKSKQTIQSLQGTITEKRETAAKLATRYDQLTYKPE